MTSQTTRENAKLMLPKRERWRIDEEIWGKKVGKRGRRGMEKKEKNMILR